MLPKKKKKIVGVPLSNGVNLSEIHGKPTKLLKNLLQQKLPAWTDRDRKGAK